MAASTLPAAEISVSGGRALLKSESLERVIRFDDGNVRTTGFRVGGREVLAAPAHEFSVAISREQSNRQPRGLRPGETPQLWRVGWAVLPAAGSHAGICFRLGPQAGWTAGRKPEVHPPWVSSSPTDSKPIVSLTPCPQWAAEETEIISASSASLR
jgi:hypothetical protein